MQGEWDGQRELLDVESVAGHLLEPGSVFALLAAHRGRLLPPGLFADLFPSRRGRPSIPGEVVASVIVLQAVYGHSDREAVDALTFDLRWKAASATGVARLGSRQRSAGAVPLGDDASAGRAWRGTDLLSA